MSTTHPCPSTVHQCHMSSLVAFRDPPSIPAAQGNSPQDSCPTTSCHGPSPGVLTAGNLHPTCELKPQGPSCCLHVCPTAFPTWHCQNANLSLLSSGLLPLHPGEPVPLEQSLSQSCERRQGAGLCTLSLDPGPASLTGIVTSSGSSRATS